MKEMKKLRRKSLRKMIKRKSVSLTRGCGRESECFNVAQTLGLLTFGRGNVEARPSVVTVSRTPGADTWTSDPDSRVNGPGP